MPDPRWLVAGVATAAAIGVVGVAVVRGTSHGSAAVVDERGDVTGIAAPAVERSIDLVATTLDRDRSRLTVELEVADLDRSVLAGDGATFSVTMQSSRARYVLRVRLGPTQEDAMVFTGGPTSRPYVLEAPAVDGNTIAVRLPNASIDDLGPRFTWGAETSAGGSADAAPQDLSALFPSPRSPEGGQP